MSRKTLFKKVWKKLCEEAENAAKTGVFDYSVIAGVEHDIMKWCTEWYRDFFFTWEETSDGLTIYVEDEVLYCTHVELT